ncbi:MAG: ATP-binding protein [Bacteroidia bacterium]
MPKKIVTIHISHDLDIVLAHKYTIQLADFMGLSLSDHTQLATAISEICRNCLEFANQGTLTFEFVTEKDTNYLCAIIEDQGNGIPPNELENIIAGKAIAKFGRGNGILYSRRLTDKIDITSTKEGTCIKLYKAIPVGTKHIRDEDIKTWRKLFENDKSASPYEEIKKRNQKLLQLADELQKKNTETEKQLEEIRRLNSELTESQHREEEGNEIFKFITENVPQIIYRLNEKGDLQFLNDHLKNYLGLRGNDIAKVKFEKFVHKSEVTHFKEKWLTGITGKKEFELIYRILRHDGIYRWHKSAIKPIYNIDGKLLMWIGTSVDIDDQKKWSEELETTVSDRTKDLLTANLELSRSNQDLEQYAYIASHDLKEPIRMVSNFTSLLARKYQDTLDTEAKEFISFIEEGAQRMQLLVNDLLKYSRVGRNNAEKKKIDCSRIIKIVRANLEEVIEVNGAQIYIENELPTLPAVESMLIQLFQNLIDNAIKFRSETYPEIFISAEAKDAFYHFKVRDNGIGIKEEYYEKIFIIFQRLHSRNTYEGTGMGLAICKKIVEYHDGKIWLEPNPDGGTIFNFTLASHEMDNL